MALGKRLSRNRAIRRQTVDKRDDSDLTLLRRNCSAAKPMYLGKQLANAPAGANLANSQLGSPLRRKDSDVSWFGKVQAKTYDAATVATRRKKPPSSKRDLAAKERLGGHPPSAPPRGLYTVEAEESWQEVYRARYRQLLLDKFLALDEGGDQDLLGTWRVILQREPYGSDDPEVRNIRHEVVQEFMANLDLGAEPDPSLPSFRPLTPDSAGEDFAPPAEPEPVVEEAPPPCSPPELAEGAGGAGESLVAKHQPPGQEQRRRKTKTVWRDVDGDGDLDMVVEHLHDDGTVQGVDIFENQDFSDTFTVHAEKEKPIDAPPGYDANRAASDALSRSLATAKNVANQPMGSSLARTGSLDARLDKAKVELDNASKYHLQRSGLPELVTGASFREEMGAYGGDEELRRNMGAPRQRR